MTIHTLGVDLAKNVFQLHGVDRSGTVVLKRRVMRDGLMPVIAQLPACTIAVEACTGAFYWQRRFEEHGHTVKIISPQYVKPFVRRQKNDGNDAEAICEAVGRPNMRFVPVKSAEQQAVLALHRTRQGFVIERTAVINRMRALLTEFGVVLPLSSQIVRRQAMKHTELLPALAHRMLEDLRAHLTLLDARIEGYDRELEAQAKLSERARRLMQIRGIGPLTALAIVATVGDARDFRSGRQFAAWIGLTPKQFSSGGKNRLGPITKRGDAYLRGLLVQGARAAMHTALRHKDRLSRWACALRERRGYRRTVVAMAAKNARIAWALLSRDQEFRMA